MAKRKTNDPSKLGTGEQYRRIYQSPTGGPGPGPQGAVTKNAPPRAITIGGANRATRSGKPRGNGG
jgi:hypothetical protein